MNTWKKKNKRGRTDPQNYSVRSTAIKGHTLEKHSHHRTAGNTSQSLSIDSRENRAHLQFLNAFNAPQFHHLSYISDWEAIQKLKRIRNL